MSKVTAGIKGMVVFTLLFIIFVGISNVANVTNSELQNQSIVMGLDTRASTGITNLAINILQLVFAIGIIGSVITIAVGFMFGDKEEYRGGGNNYLY